ncbi:MAG: SseB family protein [Gemmobacter sp.]
MTPLDHAFAAMLAEPDDDGARLAYYAALADTELFLLLEAEPEKGNIRPRVFPVEDGPLILAFDTEERLADFTGMPSPYAALPGRVVARQVAGQGAGLGVNLGTDSAWIVVAEALAWLADTLDRALLPWRERPGALHAPAAADPRLLAALSRALARAGAGGLVSEAVLAGAGYDGGRRGLLLAILDADPATEPALAGAVSEALVFAGLDVAELDVTFLGSGDPVAEAARNVGVRLELPPPQPAPPDHPRGPGTDPDRPPRLR